MRARVAWVAAGLCCCVVAACGRADPVRGLLAGDGIGNLRFGQTADRVAGGLERLLGRSSSGYVHFGCGFDEALWTGLAERASGSNSVGLTVYVKHSRFVGYSYGPPYGGPLAPAVRHGLMLSTSKGLGLDEPLARGRRLYGQAFVVTAPPQGTPSNPRLARLPAWKARTASGPIYGYVDSPHGPGSTYQRAIGSISAGAIPNTPCGTAFPAAEALHGSDTTVLLWPAGPPIFGDLPGGGPGTTVNVVDLNTGNVSVKRIPGIAGGDFPYQIVAVGRRLVYNSGSGVVVTIGENLAGVPRVLGTATWFVPSVNGHVLLVHAKDAYPVSVRSVSVATGASGPEIKLPTGTQVVIDGTARGLLLLDSHGPPGSGTLELWRPQSTTTKVAYLPDVSGAVGADARVVAYGSHCTWRTASYSNGASGYQVCSRLHVVDLLDARRFAFPAPTGTLGWVTSGFGLDNAIAPDGTMMAAQAAIAPARAGQGRLFVLRLGARSNSATAVPDSAAALYARTAWSTSDSWLLYQGPGARLHAFQLSGRSQTLDARCCQYAAMVSILNNSR